MSLVDPHPIGTADLFFGEVFYSASNTMKSTRWRGEIRKASEYINGLYNILTKILPGL